MNENILDNIIKAQKELKEKYPIPPVIKFRVFADVNFESTDWFEYDRLIPGFRGKIDIVKSVIKLPVDDIFVWEEKGIIICSPRHEAKLRQLIEETQSRYI